MTETNVLSVFDLPTTTFQIVQSSTIIEEPYPSRSDVEPQLVQNADGLYILTIYSQGERGKFDMPYISNHIVYANDELIALVTGYHGTEAYGRRKHKHVQKGQFWRFYQRIDDGIWEQIDWKHLGDETRQIILTAQQEHAPSWVRVPGKLKAEYNKPSKRTKTTAYKLVQVIDGRYYSIYDRSVEYMLGEQKKEAAKPGHRGGYFSYPTQDRVLELFHNKQLFPYQCYREPLQVALLECEIGGRIIEYGNGKLASTYLKPISVISTLEYKP